jgi:ABC-type amino acid transport substrate-binding protein
VKKILPLAITAMTFVVAGPTVASAETALERLESRKILSVCADPYIYPYSSASSHPPGFDIEIIQQVAERNGLDLEYVWVDTGTRGGLGRALRNSIVKGQCAVFTGIAVDDDQIDELAEKNLVFTDPYLGLGYLLVVKDSAEGLTGLDDFKDTKVGVSMATPIDAWLFDEGYPRELYRGNRRVMKGLAEGEIKAALVWMTTVSTAIKEFPDQTFAIVQGYDPQPGMRWNLAFAVPKDAPELKQMIDETIAQLISEGEAAKIVEGYGLPYYKPFND